MYDEDVLDILKAYSKLAVQLPPSQFTVAASFYLLSRNPPQRKILSLSTGTKCLPTIRYPLKGEALHDSHAEVLARRGALRWFLQEIQRCQSPTTPYCSSWIRTGSSGKYALSEGVQLCLYISTVPCGDASTRFLASVQDEEVAVLKNSSVFAPLGPGVASRGRDNYARLGVLRTKPGRADSPPTMCMSCSDKIALWCALGIQGTLASRFLDPLHLNSIVIGEVPVDMQVVVREDCERAFWKRLVHFDGFHLHIPTIQFTTQTFIHSRSVIETTTPTNGSCNEALCWVADDAPHEFVINGLKRGVSPKHRFRDKSRPRLCKLAMFQLYDQLIQAYGHERISTSTTYYDAKRSMSDYQAAKIKLIGPQGTFSGWVRSGEQWQSFHLSQHSPQSPKILQSKE